LERVTNLRKKIDKIDEEILLLLKERVEVSELIGKIKREEGTPIRDPKREEEKYRQIIKRASELGLSLENVENIYRNIIAMSIQAQEKAHFKGPTTK
jgi:chorismate mutase